MVHLNTTEVPETHADRVERAVERQRRRDAIQSAIVGGVTVALLGVILWLIAILPAFRDAPVIVTYSAPPKEDDNPADQPDLARGMRPKPTSSSSARARVIAAQLEAPIAVPMPDNPDPLGPFGIDDDFNAGFGAGEGDGDGGGGASFFGTPRQGRRVVYLVDFSGSMASDVEDAGGTRITALKKELVRSIDELSEKMNFAVLFFSHNAWTIDIDDPDAGWNGLNQTPIAAWYPASPQVKQQYISKVQAMNPGGNTAWYPPLKMAFAMIPQPDIIYLLSDGEPRDFDTTMAELDAMNPHGIPIDTIAFELPGTPARMMMEIAQETGGRFTLVYKGKRLSGPGAEKYTGSEFNFGDGKGK